MRKKIVALMLSFALVLSLTACGGNSKDEKKADTSPATEAAANESVETSNESEVPDADGGEISEELLSFLEQLTILEFGNVAGTEWGLAGGMLDGVEMEEADLEDVLTTNYGGTLNIVFDSEENISMVQGKGTLAGTYAPVSEKDGVVGIVFDFNGTELKYAGLFAEVEGREVLMLFPDDSGKNVFYFTQN